MNAEVFVSGNSFQLIDGPEPAFPDPAALEASNGLLCAFERGGMVLTGIDMGTVRVGVQALADEPGLDLNRWDEVVDVSIHAPEGRLGVVSNLGDDPLGLPFLTSHGSGTYRVRVNACGRALAPKAIVNESEEEYLLQAWPAQATADFTHRVLFHRLRI